MTTGRRVPGDVLIHLRRARDHPDRHFAEPFDLDHLVLRAANLTVTEVCHAVGYSSLGSFSSRFRQIVGESPSDVQRRYAAAGNPRIPGCSATTSSSAPTAGPR